jgi:hypothetical protein
MLGRERRALWPVVPRLKLSRRRNARTGTARTARSAASSTMAPGSSIPYLAALPLHSHAGGIADLDPDAARAGSIRAIDLLRNCALGPKLARMGEHGRPIFGNVFVQQDSSLGVGQQARQRSPPPCQRLTSVVGARKAFEHLRPRPKADLGAGGNVVLHHARRRLAAEGHRVRFAHPDQFGRCADLGLGGNAGLVLVPRSSSSAITRALSSFSSAGT